MQETESIGHSMYVDMHHRPWAVVRATVLLVSRGQALFLTNPWPGRCTHAAALPPTPCHCRKQEELTSLASSHG